MTYMYCNISILLDYAVQEDFQFLEAARIYSGGCEPPKLNYADITGISRIYIKLYITFAN